MNSSSPSRNTRVRKPSHFGSKIQPSPGGSLSTRFASIGRTGGFTGRSILHPTSHPFRKSSLFPLGRPDGPWPRLFVGAPVAADDHLHRLFEKLGEGRVLLEIDAGSPGTGILSRSAGDDGTPRTRPLCGRLCRRPCAAGERSPLWIDERPGSRHDVARRIGNRRPASRQRKAVGVLCAPVAPLILCIDGGILSGDLA